MVHEARVSVPARATEGGEAAGESRVAGRAADRQLFCEYQGSVWPSRRYRGFARRPEGDERAAGNESGKDGIARDAARVRLFFAARADGRWCDREPRAARSHYRRLV